jgi:hypothetical protein
VSPLIPASSSSGTAVEVKGDSELAYAQFSSGAVAGAAALACRIACASEDSQIREAIADDLLSALEGCLVIAGSCPPAERDALFHFASPIAISIQLIVIAAVNKDDIFLEDILARLLGILVSNCLV